MSPRELLEIVPSLNPDLQHQKTRAEYRHLLSPLGDSDMSLKVGAEGLEMREVGIGYVVLVCNGE